MTRFPVKQIAAAVAVMTSVACGSERATSPESPTPLDLAPILTQIAGASAAGMRGAPLGALAAGPPVATPWVPADCPYSETTHGFMCPTINVVGMEITRSYYAYDAAGKPQSVPDKKTTASVRTVVDMTGTLPPPSVAGYAITTKLTRHEDMTLSGLLTDASILNGTETTHYDGTLVGGGTTVHTVIDETGRTTNLVLPPPDAIAAWPKSGTIALDQTIRTTTGTQAAVTITAREVMNFSGSSTVIAALTFNGVTTTCSFDLSNPGAGPRCS